MNKFPFEKRAMLKISVVIPTLNEEKAIEKCLLSLAPFEPSQIIVADGGSTDRTVDIASRYADVLVTKKGRAHQMNEGAKVATGDILLFLHADTLLPEKAFQMIRDSVRFSIHGGRFYVRFDSSKWSLRLFSWYTRFHAFSYGDQGFFVTRETFDELSGFDEKVPFEDIDFYKRLSKITKPRILGKPVTTSARRFIETGCWKQKWINIWLVFLYYFGFDVLSKKAELYPDIR